MEKALTFRTSNISRPVLFVSPKRKKPQLKTCTAWTAVEGALVNTIGSSQTLINQIQASMCIQIHQGR